MTRSAGSARSSSGSAVDAVHHRHLDVEHQHVDRGAVQLVECDLAVHRTGDHADAGSLSRMRAIAPRIASESSHTMTRTGAAAGIGVLWASVAARTAGFTAGRPAANLPIKMSSSNGFMMYSCAPCSIAWSMCDMSVSVVQNTTGGRSRAGLGSHRLEEVDAVHHRHVPVEQHAVGHRHVAGVQRLLAVRGLAHREAMRLQDAPGDLAHDAAVIHDQAGAPHGGAVQPGSPSASSRPTSSTTSSRSSSR